MHFEETFPGSIEPPPLQDVIEVVDGTGVSVGVKRAFRTMSGLRGGRSDRVALRCVEIPVVGSDGEVSGVLCDTSSCDAREE